MHICAPQNKKHDMNTMHGSVTITVDK